MVNKFPVLQVGIIACCSNSYCAEEATADVDHACEMCECIGRRVSTRIMTTNIKTRENYVVKEILKNTYKKADEILASTLLNLRS